MTRRAVQTSVPASGDRKTYGAVLSVSSQDRAHRQQLMEYVLQEAQPFHQTHLRRLYALWEEWNERYYSGALVVPYLLLSHPSTPRTYGQCYLISSWGGKAEIRIRPSLLWGSHPHVRPEETFAEGRFLFVADILLHEMIHQYQQEISGKREGSYHGHGPGFRDICNRIGADLGVPPVRSMKKRGADEHLPSCAQWPHCVRDPGYYQGAYSVPDNGDTEQEQEPDPRATSDVVPPPD